MKFTSSTVLLSVTGAALAAGPIKVGLQKRADIDATILNYALSLEHLEATFYSQGLANFSQADFDSAGFSGDLRQNIVETSADEAEHVTFLTAALKAAGYKYAQACKYDFGVTSVKGFIETAAILEGVGVTAYLGAASLITNKDYLTVAGSILTVEARHSAYIRNSLGESPAATPFDTPLDFDEVYTLAAPFIVSCPKSNPSLPVKAFPSLTSLQTAAVSPGSSVSVSTDGFKLVPSKGGAIYAAWITINGPVFVPTTSNAAGTKFTFKVPTNAFIGGQSYVILTGCSTHVDDTTVAAGPAIIEVTSVFGNTS